MSFIKYKRNPIILGKAENFPVNSPHGKTMSHTKYMIKRTKDCSPQKPLGKLPFWH